MFPLVDLRLRRQDCIEIIRNSEIPIPEKSSCFFCPFKRYEEWIDLKNNKNDLFKKAINLEKFLNYKREKIGKDAVYLSSKGKSLQEIEKINYTQTLFEFDEDCSGHCWT